jgi:hypothetical protein
MIMTLLIIGGLVAGGALLYHSGFANGYNAAVLAANASGKAGVTPLPYNGYLPYGPGFGFPIFSLFAPLGLFLGIGFFFLLIFMIGGVFRLFGWRRWAAQSGMAGFGHHHQDGAWFREWVEHTKSRSEKASGPGDAPTETH